MQVGNTKNLQRLKTVANVLISQLIDDVVAAEQDGPIQFLKSAHATMTGCRLVVSIVAFGDSAGAPSPATDQILLSMNEVSCPGRLLTACVRNAGKSRSRPSPTT